jgi:hypothetical protein
MVNKRSPRVKSQQIPDLDWHPFAEKFPLLEGSEWESFVASIEATGNNEVPITYRMVGRRMQGLDGRNRYLACQKLGIKPRMNKVHIADTQVKDYIIRRNVNRRHLTPELRREIVGELRADGKSIREIAELTGASVGTVHADLKSGVQNRTPEAVLGRDGKSYPAQQPTREPGDGPAPEEQEPKPANPNAGSAPSRPAVGSREPGDGTAEEEQPPPRAPGNGQQSFDWSKFHHDYQEVQKALDQFGKAYRCKPVSDALGEKLDSWRLAFHADFQRVTGTKPPRF